MVATPFFLKSSRERKGAHRALALTLAPCDTICFGEWREYTVLTPAHRIVISSIFGDFGARVKMGWWSGKTAKIVVPPPAIAEPRGYTPSNLVTALGRWQTRGKAAHGMRAANLSGVAVSSGAAVAAACRRFL